MQRMIVSMQNEIAQDSQLANASYCALVLRLSTPDLVREFDVVITAALRSIKFGTNKPGMCVAALSLSMDDDAADSSADFRTSTALFDLLCANARAQKVEDAGVFNKDFFLTSLKDAFLKSRIAITEVARLMPYAQRALNTELVNLYGKLDSL